MSWQKAGVITGTIVSVLAILFGIGRFDSFYAHAEEMRGLAIKVEYTNIRLEQKIVSDEIRRAKYQLWDLELKKESGAELTPLEKKRVKELQFDIEQMQADVQDLRTKEQGK